MSTTSEAWTLQAGGALGEQRIDNSGYNIGFPRRRTPVVPRQASLTEIAPDHGPAAHHHAVGVSCTGCGAAFRAGRKRRQVLPRLTLDGWQPALACGLITLAATALEVWFVPRLVRAFLAEWARHGAEPGPIVMYGLLAVGCVGLVVQPALATARYLRPDPRHNAAAPVSAVGRMALCPGGTLATGVDDLDHQPGHVAGAPRVGRSRRRTVLGLAAVLAVIALVSVCAWNTDRESGPSNCGLVYMGACVDV